MTKTTATQRTKPASPTDAIALLESDHREVESLFKKFEKAPDDQAKSDLAREVCKQLLIHATIEEEIFYPGVQDEVDDDIQQEAYVEHDGAKVLIAEILAGSPSDEFFDAKVKVLSEMIKHHVNEEEQRNGMFAQAKRGDVDLEALGEALRNRKTELVAEFDQSGLPPPETKVMAGGKVVRGSIAVHA